MSEEEFETFIDNIYYNDYERNELRAIVLDLLAKLGITITTP